MESSRLLGFGGGVGNRVSSGGAGGGLGGPLGEHAVQGGHRDGKKGDWDAYDAPQGGIRAGGAVASPAELGRLTSCSAP